MDSNTPSEVTADEMAGPDPHSIGDWSDLGREMWSYLTGRQATVSYAFDDMVIEVPRDIGPHAPRATWRINGTIRVTTSDNSVSDLS